MSVHPTTHDQPPSSTTVPNSQQEPPAQSMCSLATQLREKITSPRASSSTLSPRQVTVGPAPPERHSQGFLSFLSAALTPRRTKTDSNPTRTQSPKPSLTPRPSSMVDLSQAQKTDPPDTVPNLRDLIRNPGHYTEEDVKAIFHSLQRSPPKAEPPITPRSPRMNDAVATEQQYKRMKEGIKRVCSTPLIHSVSDPDLNMKIIRRHEKKIECLQVLEAELEFRYKLGMPKYKENEEYADRSEKDEHVLATLANKQIKSLAAQSDAMFAALTTLEQQFIKQQNKSQISNESLSPRKLQNTSPNIQELQRQMRELITKQDAIVFDYLPQFIMTAKVYFQTTEILEKRPLSKALHKKFFSDPETPRGDGSLLSPRGKKS